MGAQQRCLASKNPDVSMATNHGEACLLIPTSALEPTIPGHIEPGTGTENPRGSSVDQNRLATTVATTRNWFYYTDVTGQPAEPRIDVSNYNFSRKRTEKQHTPFTHHTPFKDLLVRNTGYGNNGDKRKVALYEYEYGSAGGYGTAAPQQRDVSQLHSSPNPNHKAVSCATHPRESHSPRHQ
eukprot:scaffold183203_cov48-Prasinocladus_malaysianus.AAC.2